ncbi:MAG: peptide ABC transporter permease [Halobacteriovorax sp.]|nr:peptide ABC transporter permease [Halobacteriovorax sp.]
MIEKYIKNDLTLKRWKRFKARKLSVYSGILLIAMITMTFIAPVISNSKPLVASINDQVLFPVIVDYHPRDIGITDSLVIEWRKVKTDWVVWPLFKWDPFESNKEVAYYPAAPSAVNPMGTDDRGRDVFARILYGFKYSILYAVLVWALCFLLGTFFGGVMGYFGGRTDFIGQRLVEVFSTVPQFFLLIILISLFTPNLTMLVIISSIFGWITISYYVRGEFLKNRKREFVEAARSMGASTSRIIVRHILPNSLSPLITFTPFVIAGNIVSLASLDYLGFGLEVPTPSWGELLAQAQKNFTIAWWLAVYPSLAIFFTLTLLNLVGEGVRDAMDPNMN